MSNNKYDLIISLDPEKDMLQWLVCTVCADRIMTDASPDTDPEFHCSFVKGIVIMGPPGPMVITNLKGGIEVSREVEEHDTCICDGCSTPLPIGSTGICWSQWKHGSRKPPWENEYLANQTTLKEW